ncbi:META domain-containing protein [Vibrio campbellii]|uniref:META domain-containing protein n=1 Tax=Vibrio campbellii TaxID=680 RepID=A0ABY5IJ89_9VIBR|nr:META domain-containing protein [Vibrio campbellii]UTZ23496.1 META domain-containing protein [Vibrio campbellii]UTZ34355.1 META domain-containing protein [Vibrio campbellii]|tara:strand:- start:1107 stop:1541 length:435 start_codon:yes stop_codon:yes gene_type:complete
MKKLILSLSLLAFSGVLEASPQALATTTENELSATHQTAIGPWRLIGINGETPKHKSLIQIAQNNFYGDTGCNRFFAQIITFEKNTLELTSISNTRMGCSITQAAQEAIILNTLEEGVSIVYDRVSELLTVRGQNNTLIYASVK